MVLHAQGMYQRARDQQERHRTEMGRIAEDDSFQNMLQSAITGAMSSAMSTIFSESTGRSSYDQVGRSLMRPRSEMIPGPSGMRPHSSQETSPPRYVKLKL